MRFWKPSTRDPSAFKCPSFNELRPRRDKFDFLRLHVKDVAACVNLIKLRVLRMSVDTRVKLEHVLRWVEDYNFYVDNFVFPPLTLHPLKSISESDFKLMEKFGKFVSATPICAVKAFCVPEWAQERKRPIFWPDINAAIMRVLLMKGLLPLKSKVRQNVFSSRYSVQFDFASWYDQMGLSIKVATLFGVTADKCLASLPMGFRPSAEVAQMVSTAIADIELPEGVNVTIYIDNIRFGGPSEEAVVKAAKEFLVRAASVGAVLNSQVIAVESNEDFLGEHYDLKKKTRSLTSKTLEKLKVARELLSTEILSFRQVAAIFGLLCFVSDVLNIPMCKYFKSLSAHRRLMSLVQEEKWDAPAPPLEPEVTDEVLEWLSLAEVNAPTPVITQTNKDLVPDVTIYVDASEHGWGAVAVSQSCVKHYGAAWSSEDRQLFNLGQSTVAEPLAVKRAASAIVSTNFKHVAVFSDHIGLVFAGNKKYGKSENYNNMCDFLFQRFPNTDFSFNFIPGVENVLADDISRGRFYFFKQ